MPNLQTGMKFRKRPVEIEAMRWSGTFGGGWAKDASRIIDWILANGGTARYHDNPSIAIDTLEGIITASPGDFIIKGVQGEFYPCKPDIFKATYEPV